MALAADEGDNQLEVTDLESGGEGAAPVERQDSLFREAVRADAGASHYQQVRAFGQFLSSFY